MSPAETALGAILHVKRAVQKHKDTHEQQKIDDPFNCYRPKSDVPEEEVDKALRDLAAAEAWLRATSEQWVGDNKVYVVEHREDVKGSNHFDTVVMALFWTEKEALDYAVSNAVAELGERQWYTIYSQVVGSEEGVGRPLIHVDRFGRVSRKVQPNVNVEFSFRPEDCE